ncbi:MAG: hypothetical protein ACXWN4_00425 [Candidatus Limnocylindrales bacterium]
MSIATAVILNLVAVVGLLALLAATMRLPYHLPKSPRAAADGRTSRRRRKAAPEASRTRRERGAPEPVYSR